MCDDCNEHCSAHAPPGLEAKSKKDVVRDCLSAFPYVWVSTDSFLLVVHVSYLTLSDSVGEYWSSLSQLAKSLATDLTRPVFYFSVCEWSSFPWAHSVSIKPANNAFPWLSRK